MDYTIDQVLDCSGLSCPLPIVKLSKAIKQLEVGKVVQLIATDPGAPADMEAWARQTGHALLSSVQDGSKYIFIIRKLK